MPDSAFASRKFSGNFGVLARGTLEEDFRGYPQCLGLAADPIVYPTLTTKRYVIVE
jgi:hypothetical protein